MDDRVNFDINNSLRDYLSDPTAVQCPEVDSRLVDCETDPERLSDSTINSVLEGIIDDVANNPETITRGIHFDSLQWLLKCAPLPLDSLFSLPRDLDPHSEQSNNFRNSANLSVSAISKILDLITSTLSTVIDQVNAAIEADEADSAQDLRQLLEIYGFFLQWTISAVEAKALEKPSKTPAARGRGKSSKSATAMKDEAHWDSIGQEQIALEVMCKAMKLKLSKIFVTTSERDTFVSLFTRPVYLILENEQRIKVTALRMHCFKLLCMAIKHHGHAHGAQVSIIQNLSYFEHLAEPMAELLHILAEQYDYPQLAEDVIRDLSNKEFNSNDTRGPKSVSTFITRLSELAPRIIMKQMTMLIKQLESESYTLRCSIIDVCGNLIIDLSKNAEGGDNINTQINAFFDVLEERFLDVNPYCRCRVLQVYMKICEQDQKFPKRRQMATEFATRSLEDKSSHVRRNAVKLLGRLIQTHPFSVMHGGQIARKDWRERLEAVDRELEELSPPIGSPGLAQRRTSTATIDEALIEDATQVDPSTPKLPVELSEEAQAAAVKRATETAATSEALGRLKLTRRYYVEALRFIDVLYEASKKVCQLLSSKNKSEVIEAMDFFVTADAYRLEPARIGIRKMLCLIWTKGNSDEGKGVQNHVIECYKGLFFDAPDGLSANDAANYVARNMISLTFGATSAELTSLEQLLSTMQTTKLVSDLVITKLWQVYGVQRREISRTQRRGAIIVLGMLALADPSIVLRETETMLAVGLGQHGTEDFCLARYTCIALRRIHAAPKSAKQAQSSQPRLPADHLILKRLVTMLELESESQEWYCMAEHAVSAVYALARHPDDICSELIRRRTKSVFSVGRKGPQDAVSSSDPGMEVSQVEVSSATLPVSSPPKPSVASLSQLLFLVGHIAIKQIVHLELCEQEFKRRKAAKELILQQQQQQQQQRASSPKKRPLAAVPTASPPPNEQQNELDLIGGTSEDDFSDQLLSIREHELLFGPSSLLSRFGPLLSEICSQNTTYASPRLQSVATLAMAKFMIVSAAYCERHLPLLITILERSADSITRANVVVALGDMAVSFNQLLDGENTDFLYRRLADTSKLVKRTCLMTLTFLILAGQVKVKGKLGEMAKLVEDEDGRCREMARGFFGELAGKDSAVYNHFVDVFSLLSCGTSALAAAPTPPGTSHGFKSELETVAETGTETETSQLSADGTASEAPQQPQPPPMEPARFQAIIRFLTSFVEKERHAKQLAEKLAGRLGRVESERQWEDVAFALGCLQHRSEEIGRVLADGYRVVGAVGS